MKHPSNKGNNQKSRSSSPSPNSRSRSRSESPNPHSSKESKPTNNLIDRNRNTHRQITKPEEGKLYLANIPINLPQQRIKQEFEKYGKVLEYKFFKKTEAANPYYYGHITLARKSEAEQAMNNITKEYNWTVQPFNTKDKEKNKSHKERNFNNLINNISNLNNLNKININSNSDLPQNDENNNNINGGNKVREILVGNLPLSTTETDLYKEFFIFGEISKIELKEIENKKCAYIKYRLISSALKALEKNDKIIFKGNTITITLSNISQRRDIKGNELGYELNENNCKLIVVCSNKNININEENILNIFEKFGKIKTVLIKNINNINHIFAEYYKPEHAKMALDELNKDVKLKELFGNGNCEINYYFKNKLNEINPSLIEPKKSNNSNNINTNMNYQNINNNINNVNNINLMNYNIMMQKMGMNPALVFQLMQQPQKNILNNQLNINNKSQINDLNQIIIKLIKSNQISIQILICLFKIMLEYLSIQICQDLISPKMLAIFRIIKTQISNCFKFF